MMRHSQVTSAGPALVALVGMVLPAAIPPQVAAGASAAGADQDLVVGNETLTLRNAGSLAYDSVIVGDEFGQNGRLDLREATILSSNEGTIGNDAGATGVVTLAEGTRLGVQTPWEVAGELTVGNRGTGTLEIYDLSHVRSGSISIGRTAGSHGTVTLPQSFVGSSLVIRGDAYVGGSAAGPGGTATINLDSNSGGIHVDGTMVVYPGGTINFRRYVSHTVGGLDLRGAQLQIAEGVSRLHVAGDTSIRGLNGTRGELRLTWPSFATPLLFESQGNVYVGGTADGPNGLGRLFFANPEAPFPVADVQEVVVWDTGVVEGSGRLDCSAITNGGLLVPGWPALDLGEGDFTQGAGGSIRFSLGVSQDGQPVNNRLAVGGTASLGGALDLDASISPDVAPGIVFTILTADAIAGTFANAEDVYREDGRVFDVAYNPTSVTLTYLGVPEPSMGVMILVPGAWMARRWWRRR